MAELKKKVDTPTPAPVPQKEEEVPAISVATEAASAQNGIEVKIDGDIISIRLSQYIAEHIGQFRSCDYVKMIFKVGGPPDITAYRGGQGVKE